VYTVGGSRQRPLRRNVGNKVVIEIITVHAKNMC
jgi:hypothetical protein